MNIKTSEKISQVLNKFSDTISKLFKNYFLIIGNEVTFRI